MNTPILDSKGQHYPETICQPDKVSVMERHIKKKNLLSASETYVRKSYRLAYLIRRQPAQT